MPRFLSVARFGMLLHYDRQPARPLQPAAVARTRLAPANNDNNHDTHGGDFAAGGIPLMRLTGIGDPGPCALPKGQISFDSRDISFVHAAHLSQLAFLLRVLG
jgi:hypothetical protein